MIATFTAYNVSLWIHICAVVVGFGATFAEAVMVPVALKMDPRHLPYVHRLSLVINQRMATPALVLILLTGIYQASDGDWDFGAVWISLSFVIVIALGALLGAYFVPTDRKLGAMATRDLQSGGLSDEYQALARREGQFGALAGFLIILAIFLMVVKPGA
jgi:uncharacterized membrane protein